MIHNLKIWSKYFDAVDNGTKPFEIRQCRDREFNVGDTLDLREWDNDEGEYTGRQTTKIVTYVIKGPCFGIDAGTCVMGIK